MSRASEAGRSRSVTGVEGIAFWGGLAGAALGAVVLLLGWLASRRRRRAAASAVGDGSTVTIERARPGPVALRGRVAVGPDGAIHEPLNGREVVWYRLTASAPSAGHHSSGAFSEVHAEHDGRDFLLDDGTRTRARITVDDAGFVVPLHVYGGADVLAAADRMPWIAHELTEQQATALRVRCIRSPTRVGRADLHALVPGSAVTVVGWLEWERGDPVVVGRPPDHPLIVYGVSEQAVDRGRGSRPMRGRRGVALVAALLVVGGGAAAWWGRSTIGW